MSECGESGAENSLRKLFLGVDGNEKKSTETKADNDACFF